MKCKLKKPLFGCKKGAVITFHPARAKHYFNEGFISLIGLSDEEKDFLKAVPITNRTKVIERAVIEPQEKAVVIME